MAEINGKLNVVLEKVTGTNKTGNEWMKQDFVIETDGNYPKKICFSLWGDKIDMLNGINPGSNIKVSFDPESREYNNRWYTELRAWKIDAAGAASPQGNTFTPNAHQELTPENDPFTSNGDSEANDDLPF